MAKKFKSITEAQLGFALKLLQSQLNDDNKSTVFSPVSIAAGLAVVYLGAQENTAEEIKNALAEGFNESQIHSHFKKLLKHIKDEYAIKEPPSPGPEVDSEDEEAYEQREDRIFEMKRSTAAAVLETVNRAYINKDINLEGSFIEKFNELYQGGLDVVNFKEGSTEEKINSFVEEVTRGKIKNLVTKDSFTEATKLILINAIYFKGRWGEEFSPDETKDANFYSAPEKITKAKMMKHGAKRWQYSETDKFQFLSLPYKWTEISMKIILPKERYGLDDVIKNLTASELNKHLKNDVEEKLIVRMPRFEVKTKFDAVPILKNMGIIELFGAEANLSKMTADKSVSVSSNFHTAFVYTDEEGTEAAAVTQFILPTCGPPPPKPIKFTADHPFLFLITDNQNHIYFCGTVTGSEFEEGEIGDDGSSSSSQDSEEDEDDEDVEDKSTEIPAKKRKKV